MLEYTKTILQKVSFDAYLFERELLKAINRLIDDKLEELRIWCYKNFSSSYPDILERCFGSLG